MKPEPLHTGTLHVMRISARIALAALFATGPIALPTHVQPGQPAQDRAADPASASNPQPRCAELVALLDEHVEWLARENPVHASSLGDLRYNDRLPDASFEATRRRTRELTHRLRRLDALETIDSQIYTEQDVVDAALLRLSITNTLESAAFHPEQMPVGPLFGPQVWLPQMHERLPFTKRKHYADYLVRLRAIPRFLDQNIAQMEAGVRAGRVPPRVSIEGKDAQCFALTSEQALADPTTSPFFKPFASLPEDDQLRLEAQRVIAEEVLPSFEKLGAYLRDTYIPASRETIGQSDSVDGLAAYEQALHQFTTTDLTADQIHALGLAEVARIRAEMMTVIARSDFLGKALYEGDELFAKFLEYLRTDPRFYYESPDELLAGYRDICKRMDANLPGLFRTLPRLPYGVKAMSDREGPGGATAYYNAGSLKTGVPGYFIANTYKIDQRPKYEMVALALHEAVPGHHLQIALSLEMEDVHEFRKHLGFTAFVEGWGLYAERLGLETGPGPYGMYEDPYDDFGRLAYEMWRACRLVVDTGMHAKGWSRQRAVDFMLANTASTETNINAEINRYIGWPGQATAYKIGELKIRALRARAEEQLGDAFDIRDFHETVLSQGSLPLDLLEKRVNDWIARTLADANENH
jgi:uncharacterized protein (DUF885 family)